MPITYVDPSQSSPSAATLTTLYTVPSATSAVCSCIDVCNRSATPTTFRVAIRVGGASIADSHYTYYDIPIAGNDTFTREVKWSLAAGTIVSVYATLATLTFTLHKSEIT